MQKKIGNACYVGDALFSTNVWQFKPSGPSGYNLPWLRIIITKYSTHLLNKCVIKSWQSMITLMSVVLRRTVCADIDWHFNNPSRSHHHSQEKTSYHVVEMPVNVTTNSPSQDYTHLDDHTLLACDVSSGFKPFTKWVLHQITDTVKSCDELVPSFTWWFAKFLHRNLFL